MQSRKELSAIEVIDEGIIALGYPSQQFCHLLLSEQTWGGFNANVGEDVGDVVGDLVGGCVKVTKFINCKLRSYETSTWFGINEREKVVFIDGRVAIGTVLNDVADVRWNTKMLLIP